VVTGDEIGKKRAEELQLIGGVLRAGGGVVDFGGYFGALFEVNSAAACCMEITLKLGGVFPQVVPLAGEAGPVGGAERSGETGGEFGYVAEVVGEWLPVRLLWVG